ncbi:uncharacterized protein [Lolium perenne]|uniref:uncharacterized protein n=1 Tax=Lolium perenne TaxID=4522 RepID=UPI003A9A555C
MATPPRGLPHHQINQSTWKLHEDLRIHVLEQITEIEGLRQHAENSRKAIQLLETRLQEETAKHSSLDELSAKVKVLEAENESLRNFMKESSSKETEARKELSEKHAREQAELIDKLEKSQGRVISTIAKNKALEAEAEAIDKLIFRKHFSASLLRPPCMFSLTELNLFLSQQALALSGKKIQT